MLIVLTGLILFVYGSKILKKIIFPICFWSLWSPFPWSSITNISFKMKIFAAQIATAI